jgi:HEAT repeat protein
METRSLIVSSKQYREVSAYELLCAAEQGFAGIDHKLLHALVDEPEKSIPDIVRFGLEDRPDARQDLTDDLIAICLHLRAPGTIPYLLALLRKNHLDSSIPLISTFQRIGAPAVEPLLEFYKEMEDEEDSDAGFVLGSLGVRDPRILEALTARLAIDPVDAGHCLAVYGDPAAIPAMREAIAKFEGEDEHWMKRSLEANIEEIENGRASVEDDEEPFDLWELYPDNVDPDFELLTEPETEAFLDSLDDDNRFAAVSVLCEESTPERLWDRLFNMARTDPSPAVRGECWHALIEAWDRKDIQKAIRECVANEGAADKERLGALNVLAGREGDRPEVHRAILDFYNRPATRARALQAMALTQESRYEEYFRDNLDDPDDIVNMQAMFGIGCLEMESEAPRLIPYFQHEDLRSEAMPCYALAAACEPTRAGLRRLYKKIDKLAGGLSGDEDSSVKGALNRRAERYEFDPIYDDDGVELLDSPVIIPVKVGRNDPCPCGSGKKYKKCCGA